LLPVVRQTRTSRGVSADLLDWLVLGLILQVLVWVVQSDVQNSIATGFIGLFYGPVFPAALAMANDVLPEEVHMVSMALM
jgi:fucose permease